MKLPPPHPLGLPVPFSSRTSQLCSESYNLICKTIFPKEIWIDQGWKQLFHLKEYGLIQLSTMEVMCKAQTP